jgi:hypothetical protein
MKPTLFFLFFLFTTTIYAQPVIQWQKCYGGTGKEEPVEIAKTSDGGSILVGGTYSNNGDVTVNHGGADIWVVKLSSAGAISWQKSYGGSADDYGTSIKQTSDGGYIFAGTTNSNNGDVSGLHINAAHIDTWVVKLDAAGNITWQKCYGGSDDEGDWTEVQETADGGYIFETTTKSNNGDVTGNHGGSDIWVVKLDNSGNLSWQKCFGGTAGEGGASIEQTADGGYIVGGNSYSSNGDLTGNHGTIDCWMFKLTATGTISWQKNYGGGDDDLVKWAHQCKDGSYIFAADTKSHDGDVTGLHQLSSWSSDIWVVKTDANGNISWARAIGGNEDENGWQIIESDDGSYVISGTAQSDDGDIVGYHTNASANPGDLLLFSLYQDGSTKWLKCLGGINPDYGGSVVQAPDTGFLVLGSTTSIDGDATNGGFHAGAIGAADYWVLKLNSVLGIDDMNSSKLKVYPTISTGIVNIELPQGYENTTVQLFNLLGQEIAINTATGLNRAIHIDNVPSGVYTLRLRNNNEAESYEIVYQP